MQAWAEHYMHSGLQESIVLWAEIPEEHNWVCNWKVLAHCFVNSGYVRMYHYDRAWNFVNGNWQKTWIQCCISYPNFSVIWTTFLTCAQRVLDRCTAPFNTQPLPDILWSSWFDYQCHWKQIWPTWVSTYQCLEDLVHKAVNKEDFSKYLQAVTRVYGLDIDAHTLQMQLQVLDTNISEKVTNIHDVIACLRRLSIAEQWLLSAVITIIKMILVLSATNASSEWSFNALRCVK